jgi:hypothetical protein
VIGTLLTILLQAPAPTMQSIMPVGRMQWPAKINPAMQPYLHCMQNEFDGAQVEIEKRNGAKGLDLAGMAEADATALVSCADERTTAKTEALLLAGRMPAISQARRVEVVDAALRSVDQMRTPLIAMLSSEPSAPLSDTGAAVRRANLPVSGSVPARIPKGVVVPNAMAPTFDKYVACFEGNMNVAGVQKQSDLKHAVDRALASCRARRAELVSEAQIAMAVDPAYPDTKSRARVVAEAFDTEDAIRRAMGEGRVLFEDEQN